MSLYIPLHVENFVKDFLDCSEESEIFFMTHILKFKEFLIESKIYNFVSNTNFQVI